MHRFSTAYGQPGITANSLFAVFKGFDSNPTWRGLYINYYNVGNLSKSMIDSANYKSYINGIGNWTEDEFNASSGME